ncbi:NUDIX domain-containing protein [Corynebacterium epidermidicanis]|uniref:NTP pyrophosphohydrolase n=1 Tax=Corynebacterium epidermidicanis TaxID=1050174 RepID=A0A0G3GPG0_9CORY|nr:NUDIX hydrolase [Corynebacterium epidermidicanis]AKK03054.1 NTP pyrophosphohydrolase [Corynebacterium epidermidicanis]
MTSTPSPGSHEFSVVDSRVLLDAPIIAVRRDDVVMPGGEVAAREIVEHFGAVAVVAFDGARIALVRQYRHCVQQRLWELPAGILDVADEDPLVCAQRELQEEAGLAAAHWQLVSDIVSSPGFCEEAVRIYLATDVHEIDRPDAHDEEADLELVWVDLHQAVEMVLRGEIVNGIAVAGIMTASHLLAENLPGRDVADEFSLRPNALARRRKAAGLGADMKRLPQVHD